MSQLVPVMTQPHISETANSECANMYVRKHTKTELKILENDLLSLAYLPMLSVTLTM
jgi:hypothetical protein